MGGRLPSLHALFIKPESIEVTRSQLKLTKALIKFGLHSEDDVSIDETQLIASMLFKNYNDTEEDEYDTVEKRELRTKMKNTIKVYHQSNTDRSKNFDVMHKAIVDFTIAELKTTLRDSVNNVVQAGVDRFMPVVGLAALQTDYVEDAYAKPPFLMYHIRAGIENSSVGANNVMIWASYPGGGNFLVDQQYQLNFRGYQADTRLSSWQGQCRKS